MKKIYVAGPYRAKSEWQVELNMRRAEAIALELWKMGFAVLCPHKNTYLFGGAMGIDDAVWLEGDKELITVMDAVVVVPNYENSSGTRAEIEWAKEHNIPVLFWEKEEDYQQLITWAKEFTIE